MIAQYTQAGAGQRVQAAGGAGERRLDPVLGDAGGPRVDGLVRGAQAAAQSIDLVGRVLAIEILTAARALDFRAPIVPAPATAAVVAKLRESVPGAGPDRHLAPEIEAAVRGVQDGSLLAAAETVTGPLP